MKITKIKTHKFSTSYGDGKVFGQPKGVRTFVLVEVCTDKKISGIGETYSGIYAPETIEHIVTLISKNLINQNPLNLKLISEQVHLPFIGQNGIIKSVISSIEIALYDITSKANKIPLFKLIKNNKSHAVKAYASGGSVVYSPKQIEKDIFDIMIRGFDSYKMRIGFQSIKKDLKRIQIARKTLGSNNNLMIDAIMGTLKTKWNYKNAINIIKQISKYKPLWIEEPLYPWNFFEYSKLNKNTKNNIAFGESFTSFDEFDLAINLKCSNFIQFDVTHCGIEDSKKVVKLAKYNKLKLATHVWGSPVALLANLHFAVSNTDIDWFEVPQVKIDFLSNESKDLYQIINGKITINENIIGLGINLNKDILNDNKFVGDSGYKI